MSNNTIAQNNTTIVNVVDLISAIIKSANPKLNPVVTVDDAIDSDGFRVIKVKALTENTSIKFKFLSLEHETMAQQFTTTFLPTLIETSELLRAKQNTWKSRPSVDMRSFEFSASNQVKLDDYNIAAQIDEQGINEYRCCIVINMEKDLKRVSRLVVRANGDI